MCGIVGLYSPDGGVCETRVERCLQKIRHRGPDGTGTWVDPAGRIGLGHRRLAMVDVKNGCQPVFNEDESIVAVVNGEFYGHHKIRRRLERLGHQFKTNSDSEILVHLYEQDQQDFWQDLRGEFAFLLWDQKGHRLIAGRDRFGVKPLVYFCDKQRVAFSSQAKALFPEMRSAQMGSPQWDMSSLAFATTLQYLPPDRTLFQGIRQVPPGHLMILSPGKRRVQSYWQFDYPTQQAATKSDDADYATAVDQTRSILVQSVLDRIPDEASYCFHLSGGVDSSAVLGIASKELGQRQKAFTIVCDGEGYDERRYAETAAQHCGADLECIQFSMQQYIDTIHESARASEGLAINGHLPAKYLLNREIRAQGYKAVLTGEGADEIFLGYEHLHRDWQNGISTPRAQDEAFVQHKQAQNPSLGMMVPFGDSLDTSTIRDQLRFVPTFLAAKATLGYRIHSMLSDDVLRLWSHQNVFAELLEFPSTKNQLNDRHPVHQSATIWTQWALAGYILKTLGDGTEMPSSVEGRTPFLDHRLFEHARRLPLPFFFRNGATKQIMRDAVRDYVADPICRRVKHAFDTQPLLLSESATTRGFLYDQLNSDAFRSQTVFCHDKVEAVLSKLDEMNPLQRQAYDPAITLMSTFMGIQELMK